jgi:Protein of unknown function (DUF2997)
MPEIQTVEITPAGEITITVKGIRGRKCTDLTRQLERALGKTTGSKATPEMYQQETASHVSNRH